MRACSHFVLMGVNTLGEAWKLVWRIRVRCLLVGRKPKTRDRKSIWCDTTTELDMKTPVWTRGEALPLDRLPALFRCPKCGNRANRRRVRGAEPAEGGGCRVMAPCTEQSCPFSEINFRSRFLERSLAGRGCCPKSEVRVLS
jgi:hypothetical protein